MSKLTLYYVTGGLGSGMHQMGHVDGLFVADPDEALRVAGTAADRWCQPVPVIEFRLDPPTDAVRLAQLLNDLTRHGVTRRIKGVSSRPKATVQPKAPARK